MIRDGVGFCLGNRGWLGKEREGLEQISGHRNKKEYLFKRLQSQGTKYAAFVQVKEVKLSNEARKKLQNEMRLDRLITNYEME